MVTVTESARRVLKQELLNVLEEGNGWRLRVS